MSQKGLTPPPPYRIFETFLNLRLIWKMLTPPSRIKLRHWFWEHIDGGYLGIFTLKRGKLSVLIFFFRMGSESNLWLRLFWKIEIPPWVFKCPNLNFRHFCFFSYPPPPLFGTLSKIFPFLNYEASPKSLSIFKYSLIYTKLRVEYSTTIGKHHVCAATRFLVCSLMGVLLWLFFFFFLLLLWKG